MTTTSTGAVSLWGVDPSDYEPHPLHAAGRTYLETNCYADVLVELLHARGDEPLAMLGFIVRTDWEGDQFTYFKPPYADLERLFGIDVHEMLPYRTLPEHVEEQLALGRTVLVEIDAWYLPDTAATSYRREHLKTTVAPETIDREAQRMRYFHNAGFFELEGEDYQGAFRMLPHFTEDVMDPFVEIVRFDAGPRLTGEALRAGARELLAYHYARRPASNPFRAWSERLAEDLPKLLAGAAEDYHAYAFVTVRMVGSAFELLADHVEWVLGSEGATAADAMRRIVEGTKTVSFRLARRRPFDPEPAVAALAQAWDEGMEALGRSVG
ncbi:MAG: DUF1839 family protein [Solirubrobacterales bacterium]|nr:DUF1839 family protein [Solirubrobacterales bacterium]MBV9472120.1 DUF1839 family protein [Solirubrobacterales bacterium]MBV9836660.1 DUF1839 family protein [Solirubrobacterales bacterium]